MTSDPATGKVNTEANLMAHAVLGAVAAQAQGNSALAGASGASMGEYIAQQMYPGISRDRLSEDQKQTVSALATLAAGLAGGVAGTSMADAVAGAQAGKNSSNNNNLSLPGGLESYGQASSTLGTSMVEAGATTEEINAALSKNAKGDLPEGQNPATGLLTAWGAGMTTVAAPLLLPATATVGSIIGAGAIGGSANVFNQLSSDGPFSATDALIATGVSALTQGKGFWFTEAASITGAYTGAKLQGKDALPVVVGAGFGTAVGAVGGKSVEIGNKYFPLVSDKTAGMAGAIGGSIASEISGSKTENKLKEGGGNK
ncbi:VENN motif pre-toxin domain-containing protein [Erwinia sp.]|uniref:VENN motif pre-toxin domain-containing protein n=1 Tax=Erwinia citreus TaxID=558 RepID=UPI003C763D48